ncbi:hypothetical protein IAD21_04064 [Abditibacteriota bacterium]|nr:hypothetical protein IAD21_04064 [Abditibacteriota bacterium]
MATAIANDPLIEELMKVDGKAEIVNGRIVNLLPEGGRPSYAAGRIAAALSLCEQVGCGFAFGSNVAFLCDLPNRKSFSPDAAFYVGPEPEMGFLPTPPVFAVEVRSENDYGPQAEREMAQKRAHYFAAGTLVVWDVDLQNEEVIAKYTSQNQVRPQIFKRGEEADAEPAVSSWKIAVDSLFPPVRSK